LVKVSVLFPAARSKKNANQSKGVKAQAELTPTLITTEAWSPTLYSKPERLTENFEKAYCVGIDVDQDVTLEEVLPKLKNYAHIVGTTTSHQQQKGSEPPRDRFRVVLFLSAPVTSPQQYKATLKAAAKQFGITDLGGASDAARWFVPCKEIVSTNLDTEAIKLLPVPLSEIKKKTAKINTEKENGQRGRYSKATRLFLAQEPASEPWHFRFIKAAMDLKEQGYSEEEAAELLRLASPILELDETDLKQLNDIFENRGGALPFRPNWPVVVQTKEGGSKPVPTATENQRYLLTEVLGFKFFANTRRDVIYFTERGSEKQLLSDAVLARICIGAADNNISDKSERLRNLISTMAYENKFDPILDPLNKLSWDGGNHIRALFETLTLPQDTSQEAREWYYLFLRRWIIGIVTKLYRPGSENNVLVFQGPQAAGKSRWLKRLAELWPEGFGEGHVSPDDKDHELRHLDNYIWHVAEFDSTTSRREVGALKDYFTKDTVNVRRPYARLPIVGQSICSFCASVNSHEFLHDATGNRRYLVIPVVSVKADHSVPIPQVMAEAKAAFEAGERQWFNAQEIAEINKLNENFISKEEYLEKLEALVVPGDAAHSISSLMALLGFEDVQLTRPIRSNIRTVLEAKGIKKKNVGDGTKFLIDESVFKRRTPQVSSTSIAADLAKLSLNKNTLQN